jgi:hypothetical protein
VEIESIIGVKKKRAMERMIIFCEKRGERIKTRACDNESVQLLDISLTTIHLALI